MGRTRVPLFGDSVLPGFEPAQGVFGGFDRLAELSRPSPAMQHRVYVAALRKSTGRLREAVPELGALIALAGQRWAAGLRGLYPAHTVKLVMRDFHALGLPVAQRTVEGWLEGQSPRLGHFIAAVQLYGWEFGAAVIAPGSEVAQREVLRSEMRRLAQELDRVSGEV